MLVLLLSSPVSSQVEPAVPTIPDTGAEGFPRTATDDVALDDSAAAAAMDEAQQYVASVAADAARRRSQTLAAAMLIEQQDVAVARAVSSRGQNAAVAARSSAPPPSARVPILMYHHVAAAPPGADAVRRDLSVSPGAFIDQLHYLRQNGYQTIGLQDLLAHLDHGAPLPARPIVLTFDDGYDDNYSQAYPILRSFGFAGVFFVLTDFVGQPGYATWENLTEMNRNGMDIEAHGRTHADLAISSAADAAWQIAGSRSVLEEKLGRPVQFYCYPSGRYTAKTVELLRAHGYRAAVTIAYGATHTAAGVFELDRIRVRGTDTLEQFAAKIQSAP